MSEARQLSLKEQSKPTLGYKSFEQRKTKELIFVFVEPIGGGAKQAENILTELLSGPSFSYKINKISLSSILQEEISKITFKTPDLPGQLLNIPNISEETLRIHCLQQSGNYIRKTKGNDYLAKKAIQKIANYRAMNDGHEHADGAVIVAKPIKVAHVIRSVKHTDELKLLKSVYGDLLFLIATSGKYEQQLNNFRSIPDTDTDRNIRQREYDALSDIDQNEGITYGQQVRKVFYRADLFLSNDEASSRKQLTVFLNLLFGKTIKSPTTEESMMFEAFAASLRSTCLSRQVGAAICDKHNELISVGWNDVPSYGGGLATDNIPEKANALCIRKGTCRSNIEIQNLIDRIHKHLKEGKIITKNSSKESFEAALKQAGISSLIEFSRAIHAEMEAILSAARSGKLGLRGGVIFVTTYPCENCVKHILAAGIKKVVYIEPYPKSRATDFFSDLIADGNKHPNDTLKLFFHQFTGIAPQAYSLLYRYWFERKNSKGVYTPKSGELTPIISVYLDSYTLYEGQIAEEVGHE